MIQIYCYFLKKFNESKLENNFTLGGTPLPFRLVTVQPLQFRAETFPTLSTDYLIMHCQFHFYDEMTRACKKTDCRTET